MCAYGLNLIYLNVFEFELRLCELNCSYVSSLI